MVLVHGVESYWYAAPTMFLAAYLAEAGYALLGYNGVHSGDSFRASEFATAVSDAGDAVSFMTRRGFDRIFLVGHSLGTPIVEYYQGDQPHPAVKALASRARISTYRRWLGIRCSAPSSMEPSSVNAARWLRPARAMRSSCCPSAAARIQQNAVHSPKAEIVVIPSSPGNSPFQAHLFVNNERRVTDKTVDRLRSVGLPPAPRC